MPRQQFSRTNRFAATATPLRCLLMGVRGAGMTAAAEILKDAGHTVFGMDEARETASDLLSIGTSVTSVSSQVPENVDICITSRAIPEHHPVLQQLTARGVEVMNLPGLLAEIFGNHTQICVAGTHGKSTTSAMLTWIMDQNGKRPSCFVGANQTAFSTSGRYAESDVAVIESCEFLQSFLNLSPSVAVLTCIERDHFDCFPDQSSEDDAFLQFCNRLPADGKLIHRYDCVRSHRIAKQCDRRTVTFGVAHSDIDSVANHADVFAVNVSHHGSGSRCLIRHSDGSSELRLSVPGSHNIQNAVAAIAAAATSGVAVEDSCRVLEGYRGIQRRFEFRGHYQGVTLVDDYAHHPTAIRETLQTARQVFPGKRILAVFEPHQMVRTAALFGDFTSALALADEVLVLPVYPARESASHLECCRMSGKLVKELNRHCCKAFLFANLDQTVSRIDHSARPNDVLITMGAGRTNLIHDKLNRRLQRNSVA